MASIHERFDKTMQFILDDDVTIAEGLIHAWQWVRFEHAVIKRNKYAVRAGRLAQKLDANLDVVELRKDMANL